jgi:O-glycosyl hydrolase
MNKALFKIISMRVNTILVLFFLSGCDVIAAGEVTQNLQDNDPVLITIHAEEKRQTIHNFGASDAWSTQFVGKYWPTEKREQIADLLFSMEFDSQGNPEGIGLSLWRFNIGAGSARQGEESGIATAWRRAESFLSADSTYNWDKQQGQQWFMKAAHERGVRQFTGFVNSPPVLLTKNGKAHGDGSGDANISPDNYGKFADYLAKIAAYFRDSGVSFTYVSPVNEPQWNWASGNGQEGSPYRNTEITGLAKALDQKIIEYGLETKIEIPETAQIDFLYSRNNDGRGNQSDTFFGRESTIRELPTLARKMAGHSYFTTYPVARMIEQRQKVWESIQEADPDLEYWMTEFCVLGNVDGVLQGNGRDLDIDPALYVARVIHYDLTIANASAWQWWLGVSPYDYKDGLIYIDNSFYDGEVYESKILWGLGNFSRFIRPGSVRVEVSRSDNLTPLEAADDILVSAYLHSEDRRVTLVAVNYSENDREIKIATTGMTTGTVSEWNRYITSSQYNLQKMPSALPDDLIKIPARSIVTVTSPAR